MGTMTRDRRRHLAQRMKRRVLGYYGVYIRRDLTGRDQARAVGKLARTRTPCSCVMCNSGNFIDGGPTHRDRRRIAALEDQ